MLKILPFIFITSSLFAVVTGTKIRKTGEVKPEPTAEKSKVEQVLVYLAMAETVANIEMSFEYLAEVFVKSDLATVQGNFPGEVIKPTVQSIPELLCITLPEGQKAANWEPTKKNLPAEILKTGSAKTAEFYTLLVNAAPQVAATRVVASDVVSQFGEEGRDWNWGIPNMGRLSNVKFTWMGKFKSPKDNFAKAVSEDPLKFLTLKVVRRGDCDRKAIDTSPVVYNPVNE